MTSASTTTIWQEESRQNCFTNLCMKTRSTCITVWEELKDLGPPNCDLDLSTQEMSVTVPYRPSLGIHFFLRSLIGGKIKILDSDYVTISTNPT